MQRAYSLSTAFCAPPQEMVNSGVGGASAAAAAVAAAEAALLQAAAPPPAAPVAAVQCQSPQEVADWVLTIGLPEEKAKVGHCRVG